MSEYTPNLNLFKYNTSTDGKEIFSITQALNRNWDILDNLGSGRNIGEILSSTIPLTDAGLHLLDGALIQGSGIYSEFVSYMANLYTDYPDLFTSEAGFQESIASFGTCGKFVWDYVNNAIRLPKITGIIEGTTDVNALGDLVQAGLPNHRHWYTTGSFWGGDPGERAAHWSHGNASTGSATGYFSYASEDNGIYGRSNTVQPQTIKVLYYIVVATSTKTDIQVDIDEIATDLNNKLDRDLTNVSNISASFKSGVIDWWIPDYNSVINLGSSVTSYTAPSDGYLYFNLDSYSSNPTVNGNLVYISGNDAQNEGCVTLVVKVGDIINIPSHITCCFIPRERS